MDNKTYEVVSSDTKEQYSVVKKLTRQTGNLKTVNLA